jgi:hypothetical protein
VLDWIIMNNKFERIWKKAVITRYLPGETEENYEKLHSRS